MMFTRCRLGGGDLAREVSRIGQAACDALPRHWPSKPRQPSRSANTSLPPAIVKALGSGWHHRCGVELPMFDDRGLLFVTREGSAADNGGPLRSVRPANR